MGLQPSQPIKTPGIGAQPYPAAPSAPTGGLFNWAKSQVPNAPATNPNRGLWNWAQTQSKAGQAAPAAPAPDPGPGSGYAPGAGTPTVAAPPTTGTESGPGILESWFNQRANGTDPGYEYAMKRGMTDLGNRSAAAGSFNSGAARQQESDFAANMAAQREGQLDALAGGASGEHQGRLNSMFNQGLGLAGGQAGLASGYDLGAGNAMSSANMGALMLGLQKAGVDSQAAQGFLNNLFSGVSLANGIGGKK